MMINRIVKSLSNQTLQAIEDRVFPGCVLGLLIEERPPIVLPFGKYTYEKNSHLIQHNSIFDIASLTKSIPTACLALKLFEMGKLDINEKIINYIPEYNNEFKEEILVKHLLAQALDCSYRLSTYKNNSPNEILEKIFNGKFNTAPGTHHFSTNTSSILLGLVDEKAGRGNLDKLSKDLLFIPMGMNKTSFFPQDFAKENIVPTEKDPWRNRIIQGEIHDETAFALREKIIAGSAGLFSTASDLLIFLKMILNNGIHNGSRIFSSKTISKMFENQFPEEEPKASLGWDIQRPYYMGDMCTNRTIGKTGFTGCSCICDPIYNLGLVILTNYHFPNRKPSFDKLNNYRRNIADIVIRNLVNNDLRY